MISLKYLSTINQLSSVSGTDIEHHISAGYQSILERKNQDGSFSFKGYDKYRSIWLTSYVLKCFKQVENLTSIEETHIISALNFLQRHQASDLQKPAAMESLSGGFIEFGSEAEPDIILTALVVISFLENTKYLKGYEEVVDKSLNFIDRQTTHMKNNLEIVISAYALSLAKHATAETLMQHLESYVISEQDKQHWDLSFSGNNTGDLSDKLEITSYALMTYIQLGKESKMLPIMMWLVEQISQIDGNFMRKDSVATVQALADLAKKFFSSAIAMDLKIYSGRSEPTRVHIDHSNNLNPVNFELPSPSLSNTIQANGTGFAMLDINFKYNLIEDIKETVTLSVAVNPSSLDDSIRLTVCANYKMEDEDDDDINEIILANMEVELPNG